MYYNKEGNGRFLRESLSRDYDLVLAQDRVDYSSLFATGITTDNSLVLWYDTNNILSYSSGNTSITSTTFFQSAITSGFTIEDIGLNLVDNGRYTNLTGETINFTSGDNKLQLYYISGDQSTYLYSDEIDSSGLYVSLSGSYFQNFYRLYRYPFELLPMTTPKGWTLEFWLKPNVNSCTPLSGYPQDLTCPDITADTQFTTEELDLFNVIPTNLTGDCYDSSNFFYYTGLRAEDKFYNIFSGDSGITTSNSAVTLFNSTYEPYSYSAYTGCVSSITSTTSMLSGITPYRVWGVHYSNINRITGTTDNGFGLRFTDDGRLGYRRVGNTSCECDNIYPDIEEAYTSFPIFRGDARSSWIHISVVFKSYNEGKFIMGTDCPDLERTLERKKGDLIFYVNGFRVMKVTGFTEQINMSLETDPLKQQGTPYIISWGGGTQGLFDTETFGGIDEDDKKLLLQKWFNGYFNGGISQFRYYVRPLSLIEIRRNFTREQQRYGRTEKFGGYDSVGDPPFINNLGNC